MARLKECRVCATYKRRWKEALKTIEAYQRHEEETNELMERIIRSALKRQAKMLKG